MKINNILLIRFNTSLSISDLIDAFISKKTKMNNNTNKIMFETNKYWSVCWFKFIKLLSINVKKVKKPVNSVMRNNIIIVIFFFKNSPNFRDNIVTTNEQLLYNFSSRIR